MAPPDPEHVEREPADRKKGKKKLKKMLARGDASDVASEITKMFDGGDLACMDSALLHEGIEELAKNIRAGGETPAQAYSRAVTDTPAGKVLMKSYTSAK